ncbi:hypothetical protein F0L74_22160 [Chitinophaga agrisoli]|uniref:Glycosyl transferase family 11 n=1 Tax=Chitinophaga agrisoli TaxID=2607653 RepID=A0A5B2VKV3_9BACT|nr:alpha-1,2-fucosyltransferase [Chitinophaga agrisoli]KAA2238922.1 hypothetical protein F0L74_22160 [Chitinophaga agrisoli]
MVVLTSLYGQTSNNFIQFIHLDSFCREHNIPFRNPRLKKYYNDYPNLRKAKLDYTGWQLFRPLKWLRMMNVLNFDDQEQRPAYREKLQLLRGRKLFCEGWFFRSIETVPKYRQLYQHLFDPAIDKQALRDKYLQRTSPDEVILALHIRRGDYKEFYNGVFYFEDDTYLEKISQFKASIGKPCKVIIFTNDDALDKELYIRTFGNVTISDNPVVADHYLMSQCDYILGPASSFTYWASYIGEKPFMHLLDKKDEVRLDRFRISDGSY